MVTVFPSSSAKYHAGYSVGSLTNREPMKEFQGLQFGVASGVVPCQIVQVLGKWSSLANTRPTKAGENVTCSTQGPHAV
jgi:hypothetical protein